ncbi:hypothetical protein MKHDV_00492 [Halodesulfovibrio sp. MK-HDV]|nr:hypothetical protein MKHDV_00492 [Halodesulfovibrio sp. MK-HDV]
MEKECLFSFYDAVNCKIDSTSLIIEEEKMFLFAENILEKSVEIMTRV